MCIYIYIYTHTYIHVYIYIYIYIYMHCHTKVTLVNLKLARMIRPITMITVGNTINNTNDNEHNNSSLGQTTRILGEQTDRRSPPAPRLSLLLGLSAKWRDCAPSCHVLPSPRNLLLALLVLLVSLVVVLVLLLLSLVPMLVLILVLTD